jgi:hypothetical protein
VEIQRMQREWPLTIKAIKDRHQRYGGITIIDSTGLGDVVLAELADIGAVGFNFAAETATYSWPTWKERFSQGRSSGPT